MVPWGTGDPINSGYLNTQVFLTEKPPPLSVSVGGGSMSQFMEYRLHILKGAEVFKAKLFEYFL